MLVQFRRQLKNIETELKRINSSDEMDEELLTPIRTMTEILESFEKERKNEQR